MLKRHVVPLPEHLYPPDEWRLVESRFTERYFERAEPIMSLGNGYLGVRGTFEEGRPSVAPGTFVNGFHETWPMLYAEPAYGLARTGQTIVNVPDATLLRLYVDDEPFFLPTARTPEYRRVLDMREGTLTRDVVWSPGSGKHVRISSMRLVSLEDRHLMVMQYVVTPLDHPAAITICSQVVNRQDTHGGRPNGTEDPRLAKILSHRVLDCQVTRGDGLRMLLGYRSANSGMTLGVGLDHVVETDLPMHTDVTVDGDHGEVVVSVAGEAGVPITITKYATYHSSRGTPPLELTERCARTLDRALTGGVDRLRRTQRDHLDRFWDRADVRVDAEPNPVRTQQAIRWNLFQIAQATWRA